MWLPSYKVFLSFPLFCCLCFLLLFLQNPSFCHWRDTRCPLFSSMTPSLSSSSYHLHRPFQSNFSTTVSLSFWRPISWVSSLFLLLLSFSLSFQSMTEHSSNASLSFLQKNKFHVFSIFMTRIEVWEAIKSSLSRITISVVFAIDWRTRYKWVFVRSVLLNSFCSLKQNEKQKPKESMKLWPENIQTRRVTSL